MKILEVTAFPPKVYAATEEEALDHQGVWDMLMGSLAWAMRRKDPDAGKDLITLADPIPRKFNPTTLRVKDLAGEFHDNKLGTAWFKENRGISGESTEYNVNAEYDDEGGKGTVNLQGDLLGDLTAANMQNNAINYWEVPDEYIVGNPSAGQYSPIDDIVQGCFSTITSQTSTGSINYGVNTSNKKAGYCQSVRVKLYSPASGESIEKNIFDPLPAGSIPSNAYSLPYAVGADLRPEGYPICAFFYADNGEDQRLKMIEYIKGGSWRKIALTNNGLAGSYFQQLASIKNRGTRALGTLTTLGGGVLLGGSGIMQMGDAISQVVEAVANNDADQATEAASSAKVGRLKRDAGYATMYGAIGSYTASKLKIDGQDSELSRKAICAATPQFTNNSDYVKDIGNNKFLSVISRYSDDDLANFDEFLTLNGYNVGNMRITNRHLCSRKNFVYVRANSDIKLIGNRYYPRAVGKSIIEKCQAQLQQGVRIWRKKPDAHNLLADGNMEINPEAYRPYSS